MNGIALVTGAVNDATMKRVLALHIAVNRLGVDGPHVRST
jgi:hypothetical protein